MSKKNHFPKSFALMLTVATTAGTIYDIITKAVGFLDLLSSDGTDAFRTFIRPAILALLALIMSIAYISSDKSAGKNADVDAQNAVPGVIERICKAIVKTCIVVVIIGCIGGAVYGYFIYKEYMQRPLINVYDYIDITPAISGYEGEATLDVERIENKFPYSISDLYSDTNTKNYDHNEDYTDRQEAWNDFCQNLFYDYGAVTTNLTNDSELKVTIDYQGKDLSKIKARTHLRIEGVGETKTYRVGDICELPHKFENAANAREEKGDVITDVENYLKNSIDGTDVSNIKIASFFCKPVYAENSSPDGLAVVAQFTVFTGSESEKKLYKSCYLYPFDSRASSDMITEYKPGFNFNEEYATDNEQELEKEIRRGDQFGTNSEYTLEVIN